VGLTGKSASTDSYMYLSTNQLKKVGEQVQDIGTWSRTSVLRCTCKHQECRNNKDNEFLSYVLAKVGLGNLLSTS
jgi:hypothetical protein